MSPTDIYHVTIVVTNEVTYEIFLMDSAMCTIYNRILVTILKLSIPTFLSQEKMAILDSYQRKAKITTSMLNSLEGITCCEVTGSLYAFPRVHLTRRAIEEAKVRTSVAHVSHDTYNTYNTLLTLPCGAFR